jgi:hypothetical protein
MAKVGEITIEVSVEAVFQKAIIEVVQKIQQDHGVIIESLRFDWIEAVDGSAKVISCETGSKYRT